jgi:hypothetical protein
MDVSMSFRSVEMKLIYFYENIENKSLFKRR